MRPEIDFFGVLVPTLLLLVIACYGLYRVVHVGLARLGLYRHVWHPALFDIALYLSLLGATVLFMEHLSS